MAQRRKFLVLMVATAAVLVLSAGLFNLGRIAKKLRLGSYADPGVIDKRYAEQLRKLTEISMRWGDWSNKAYGEQAFFAELLARDFRQAPEILETLITVGENSSFSLGPSRLDMMPRAAVWDCEKPLPGEPVVNLWTYQLPDGSTREVVEYSALTDGPVLEQTGYRLLLDLQKLRQSR